VEEAMKYFTRFMVLILFFSVGLWGYSSLHDDPNLSLLAYKVMLASVGMGMAEAFWIVFFKPIFGSLDKKSSKEKLLVGAIRVAFYILICGVTLAHGI